MELSTLRAFVEVAQTGSFSSAADNLFLTQPAVSKRVSALEKDLNTVLFDRLGRQVALTESGRKLLPKAESILHDLSDIHRLVRNLSGEISGDLLIGTSHHIGLHRLPPVLRRYTRSHPHVKLDIGFKSSEEICHAVERGELELGIVTLPLDSSAALDSTHLWNDPLSFVVAEDHPLADLQKIPPETLLEYPAVLPNPATFTRTLLENAFADIGEEIRCDLSTDYLETLKMLVSIGLGWSLLPATLISSGLAALDVNGISLQRSLGVVRHRRRTLSNAAKAMLELLEEFADSSAG